MAKIPEDVMKAAREAYLPLLKMPKDVLFVKSVRDGDYDYDYETPIKASARAILAERERCEADAASLRGLLAEAGEVLEPFASGANRMDISASIRKYGIRADYPELSAARTVATKIEEELK